MNKWNRRAPLAAMFLFGAFRLMSPAVVAETPNVLREQPPAANGPFNPPGGEASTAADEAGNPYLAQVDEIVLDPAARAAIRRVQPACVRIGRGSGVTISADGMILTAAHIAHGVDIRCTIIYPDGRKFIGNCIAINNLLDLAHCQVVAMHNSWAPDTRMRHAVTHEAISQFLADNLPKAGR